MRLNYIPTLYVFALTSIFLMSCSSSRKSSTAEIHSQTVHENTDESLYRGSATIMHDLLHTRLDVSFDWENQRLLGSAELTLKPHFYSNSKLYLNARGMQLNEVSLLKDGNKTPLAYDYKNDSINIILDKSYSAKDTFSIYIDYVSKPEELSTGGSAAITSDKGLYFINADKSDPVKPQQVWTQGETQSNSVWFPTIDQPNQKSTQEIYVTVDTAFTTLSNGLKISSIVNASNGTRTDYWRQDKPHSPYLFMMAVGKYAIVKDSWRNKEISYYVEPEYEKYARLYFGNTPEMLEFFSTKLGMEYVWDKYSQVIVRDYVSGAMENTTATIFGEFMNQEPREMLDRNYEDVVSHELFHHWFGDLVTMESWSNVPLNESFATYGEYLWNEYKYGLDEADYWGQNDLNSYLREARSKQVNLIRYYYKKQEDMFDSHSYAKGGRVLHMLRNYTGDEAFFSALKIYLQQHKFKNVEIHDLRLAFEEVTGEDLNWFFNEWFLDKGHPSLKIDYSYDEGNSMMNIAVEQMQNTETAPLYKIPVDVDLYTSNAVERIRINVSKRQETFAIKSVKPVLVNFDSRKMLLGTKTDNHSNSEWIEMYNRCPLYLDRYEAISKVSKDYAAGSPTALMISKALDDKHWNIRIQAIKGSRALLKSNENATKEKLIQMVSKDPKAAVRSAALLYLSEMYPADSTIHAVALSAVRDSSFDVIETAISHLIANNKLQGMTVLKNMEAGADKNTASLIASFYSLYGTDDEYNYMLLRLRQSEGQNKYTDIIQFGRYLLLCKPATVLKGMDEIASVGMHHNLWFVRFSAAQALAEIAKSYGKSITSTGVAEAVAVSDPQMAETVRKKAETLLSEVKGKETDAKLLKIYTRD
jgi:aminopeptidase N